MLHVQGSSSNQENIEVLESIQHDILSKMHMAEDGSKMFICDHELREVWGNYDLKAIFPERGWTDEQRKQIRSQYLKVISLLICINWMSLSNFRASFFMRSINDSSLPLKRDQLRFLGLGLAAHLFKQMQYAFIPVVIKEFDGPIIQEVRSEERLPFIRNFVKIGSGGFGVISEVTIAPRHLSHESNGTENGNVKAVACKMYKNDRHEKDFRAELENLQYLKEDLGAQGTKRIMIHIASIVHGNDFMILLPLAELRDLEVFLRYGYEAQDSNTREETQVYEFDKEFPGLSPSILQNALFKELFQIASALVWLHEEIRVQGFLHQYCAHMDLKPDNILIKRDHNFRVGKWMISDFGISIFDKRTDQIDLRVQSIRDVGRRLTSTAHDNMVSRGHGPYQPPEIDDSRVDGRKCDVWSFGCIVSDVLRFCLEESPIQGKRALEIFRNERWYEGDDYFYKTKTEQSGKSAIRTKFNTELKPEISGWLDSLSSNPPYPWVRDCVTILKKGLVIDPDTRLGTKAFMEDLDSLSSSIPTGEISEKSHNRLCTGSSLGSIQLDPGNFLDNVSTKNGKPPVLVTTPSTSTFIPSTADVLQSPVNESFDSQVKTSLLCHGKLKDVAFSSGGDLVALLSESCVQVFAVADRWRQIAQFPLLPSDAKWREICMANPNSAKPYLAVYGIQRSGAKAILVSDIDNHIIQVPTIHHGGPVSSVMVSNGGIVAYVFRKMIVLSHIRNGDQETLDIKDTKNTINQAAFGASGQYLCVWTTGESTDQCYFWDVKEFPARELSTRYYEKVPTSSTTFTLWPYTSAPACILRESHGDTFIAQATCSNLTPRRTQQIGIKNVLIGCVSQDDRMLVCVEDSPVPLGRHSRHRISGYPLSMRPDDTRFEKCSKTWTVKASINDKAKIFVSALTEGPMIKIFTINGEILRYNCSL